MGGPSSSGAWRLKAFGDPNPPASHAILLLPRADGPVAVDLGLGSAGHWRSNGMDVAHEGPGGDLLHQREESRGRCPCVPGPTSFVVPHLSPFGGSLSPLFPLLWQSSVPLPSCFHFKHFFDP